MKTYYINGNYRDDLCGAAYKKLIEYMVPHSDAFSFVFYQNREGEKRRVTVRNIKQALNPFKVFSKKVFEWPGMITMDYRHVYLLSAYVSHPDVIPILNSVNSLYEWDYPVYPMDLSFYKDGYAIFASVAHECWNCLYAENRDIVYDLKKLGFDLELCHNEKYVYYDERLKNLNF